MDANEARALIDRLLFGDEPEDSPVRRRKVALLRAASARFVERGYAKTTVAELAEAAGVSKPTLYAYYPSKAHLLFHAIGLEKRDRFERMAPIFDAKRPARARLRLLVELAIGLPHEMPLTASLMRGEPAVLFALQELDVAKKAFGPDGPRAEAMRTWLYEELLTAIAGDRLGADEIRERAKVLVALSFCTGPLADPELRQGLTLERTAALLATMLAAGVDAPTKSRTRR